jgi:hypothetical protein
VARRTFTVAVLQSLQPARRVSQPAADARDCWSSIPPRPPRGPPCTLPSSTTANLRPCLPSAPRLPYPAAGATPARQDAVPQDDGGHGVQVRVRRHHGASGATTWFIADKGNNRVGCERTKVHQWPGHRPTPLRLLLRNSVLTRPPPSPFPPPRSPWTARASSSRRPRACTARARRSRAS